MRNIRTLAVLIATLFPTHAMGQQIQPHPTPGKPSSTERGKQIFSENTAPHATVSLLKVMAQQPLH
jgi:hypothetical protein